MGKRFNLKSQFSPKRAINIGFGPKWLKIDHEELFIKGTKKGQKLFFFQDQKMSVFVQKVQFFSQGGLGATKLLGAWQRQQ